MIIENRDALLKERELAQKEIDSFDCRILYVQEPAVLPPVLKKSMRE